MFEETELAQNALPLSGRKKACLNQCRLALHRIGKPIHEGNCPCDCPSDCIFQFGEYRKGFEKFDLLFPDVREYYKQLAEE